MGVTAVVLLVITLATGYLTIHFLNPYAKQFGLVDIPNHRKHHSTPTALIGGISIYVAILVASLLYQALDIAMITYLMCSTILVILGVLDAQEDLSPHYRLIVESIVALGMCFMAGMYLKDLGDLTGSGTIEIQKTGYLLTVIAVIAAINAFNMIDGIDGLLGITSIITFWTLGALCYRGGNEVGVLFAVIVILALLPYLAVNLQVPLIKQAKIFMGDTGSMLIGFTVVWLLVLGTQTQSINHTSFAAPTALWIIAIPLMDMVRVMLGRYFSGKSIFAADRTHLHHILLQYNNTKHNALLKISALVSTSCLIGVMLEVFNLPDYISLALFLIAFGLYTSVIGYLQKRIIQQSLSLNSL